MSHISRRHSHSTEMDEYKKMISIVSTTALECFTRGEEPREVSNRSVKLSLKTTSWLQIDKTTGVLADNSAKAARVRNQEGPMHSQIFQVIQDNGALLR